jgi:hypothetical protein
MVHLFLGKFFCLGEEISHVMDHVVIVALDEVVDDQLLPVDDRRCLLRSPGEFFFFFFFFFGTQKHFTSEAGGEFFHGGRLPANDVDKDIYTSSRWGIPLSFR